MGFDITYDIRDENYIIHTKNEEVQSNKDEMGLPYIDAKKPRT